MAQSSTPYAWIANLIPSDHITNDNNVNIQGQQQTATVHWCMPTSKGIKLKEGDICTFVPQNANAFVKEHKNESIYNVNMTAVEVNDKPPTISKCSNRPGEQEFLDRSADLSQFLKNITTAETPGGNDFFTHARPILFNLEEESGDAKGILIVGWTVTYNPNDKLKGKNIELHFVYGDPYKGTTRVDFVS